MEEKSLYFFFVFFKHLLELQNMGLRCSENMNPDNKKMCYKFCLFHVLEMFQVSVKKKSLMSPFLICGQVYRLCEMYGGK